MASLNLSVFAAICLLLTVALGQRPFPDDDAGRVLVIGELWADTFTDGSAIIKGGVITAESMTLSGDLTAGDAYFASVSSADTWLQNLYAPVANVQDLWATDLTSASSLFQQDLYIKGSLTSESATLGETTVTSLEVMNDANIEGSLYAQTNLQVSSDVNVGGNSRLFGDVLANMTATVEGDLRVHGPAHSESLFVEMGWSQDLTVENKARVNDLWVHGMFNNGGNMSVGGDSHVSGDFHVDGWLNTNSATLNGSLTVHDNATVAFHVSAESVTSRGLWVGGESSVQEDLSVGSYMTTHSNLTVDGETHVQGDIHSEGTITAVDAIFQTLQVDTASIEELTATFVMAQTVNTQDTTVLGTFVVTGMSTMESLDVKSTSTFEEVWAESVTADELGTELLHTASLTATGDSVLDTVEVKNTIVSGRPSEWNWAANFENAYADHFKAMELDAEMAEIPSLTSQLVDYENIEAMTGNFERTSVVTASIDQYEGTWAEIDRLWSYEGNITTLMSEYHHTTTVEASGDSTITMLTSAAISSGILTAEEGWFNFLASNSIVTEELYAHNGTVTELTSTEGTIVELIATNGMITTLTTEDAWIDYLHGETLNYEMGSIDELWTKHYWSWNYNVTGGSSTDYFDADISKVNQSEVMTLHVTEGAWIQEAIVKNDLTVEGFTSFQQGLFSGEAVVSALTVAGDSLLSDLSVTGPAYLTDLLVKRVTISEDFEANQVHIMDATIDSLNVVNDANVGGTFEVDGDTSLGGNLVVSGTTQFQTGSFSRIGTAIITTTDMEAFNMDVANGLFGSITVDDLRVNRGANFERTIQMSPMRNSVSGSPYSFISSVVPQTLTAIDANIGAFDVHAATVFHSGFATIDQLAVARGDDPTKAALRVTGDGALDLLGGNMLFRNLVVGGGIRFENENNAAWTSSSATPSASLTVGSSDVYYTYSDLVDREFGAPGAAFDPSRFSQPSDLAEEDLLTLSPGHYLVSGNVYFSLSSPATSSSVLVATGGIDFFAGTESAGSPVGGAKCTANFKVVSGQSFGGSCYFSNILIVSAGNTRTLRTNATWNASTNPIGASLRVNPRTSLVITELFERTSQGL